jgi:capsular polysaccharide biosynthesis protein
MSAPKKIFEAYELKDRKKPLNYEEMVGRQHIVGERFEWGPTLLYELNNAYATPYGVVYKNHQVFRPSLSEYNDSIKHLPTYIKKKVLNKVVKVKGTSVVFLNPFYGNFYHFTAECLTRLFCVYDQRDTVNVIIPADSPDFVESYVKILGFRHIVRLAVDELAHCERLLLPTQTTHVHKQHPEIIDLISARLREYASGNGQRYDDFKRIYVSRAKASYRRPTNEAELVKLLERYGFKIISFEDYSIEERVLFMKNVEVIMGVHGAGLTNMLFMDKGKIVFHLIHEGQHEDTFYNLATAMKHDSVFIQGKAANEDPRGVCYDNFEVDLVKLEGYLKEL